MSVSISMLLRASGAYEPPEGKGGEGASDCIVDVLVEVLTAPFPYMEGGTCSGYREAHSLRRVLS